MNIQLTTKISSPDLLIVPSFKGEETKTLKPILGHEASLMNLIQTDYQNSLGSAQIVYTPNLQYKRVMLLGLGEKKLFNPEALRNALQAGMLMQVGKDWETIAIDLRNLNPKYLEIATFAIIFGSYTFDQYKQNAKVVKKSILLVVKSINAFMKKASAMAVIMGEACNSARDLANHPGNVATPSHLAKHALQMARKNKIKCQIFGPKEIKKLGLGLLEAVSKGSDEEAKFIVLEYLPAGRSATKTSKNQPIVLIGKGLTFDSGGISIKPAEQMEEMKFDMAGGATVLGVMEAAVKLKLPHYIVGIIPSSENLISGRALKPGDIIKSYNGKTVEIINTDAEGRLILADAITYAQKHFQPRLMIDYATLTGAVVVALGNKYAGVFSNNPSFDKTLNLASKLTGEKIWRLPLAKEYQDDVKSRVADLKNAGEKGFAGSINGALFLEAFVDSPWIHMDIAGTAWSTKPKPDLTVGATGWGVYLTIQFLRQLASRNT